MNVVVEEIDEWEGFDSTLRWVATFDPGAELAMVEKALSHVALVGGVVVVVVTGA